MERRNTGRPGQLLTKEECQVKHDFDPLPRQNIVDGSQCPSCNHQIVDENDPFFRPIRDCSGHQLKVGRKNGLSSLGSTPGLLRRIFGADESGKGNRHRPEAMNTEGECIGNGKVPTNKSAFGRWNRKKKLGAIWNEGRESRAVKKNVHRLPISPVFCQTEESGHRTGIEVNNPDPAFSPDHLPGRIAPDRIVFTIRTEVPMAGFLTAGQAGAGK